MSGLPMNIDAQMTAMWIGNSIVPVFLLWYVLWKPTPSRWHLAARLLGVWIIMAKLVIVDSFHASGPVLQYVVPTLCVLAAIAGGLLASERAIRLSRGNVLAPDTIDSDIPGSPT